jgi:hypothetical protein
MLLPTVLFVVSAILQRLAWVQEKELKKMVEDMPNIGKQIIHEHEEIAENLHFVFIGCCCFIEVFSKYKKHAKAKLISYVALVIGIAVYVATLVGTSGAGLFVIPKLEDSATSVVKIL